MAPKPRPRGGSIATTGSIKTVSKSISMPPPPDPPTPLAILEPEINGLSTCLKNAAVKMGQIYGFYADTHKLGIQKHVSKPPQSLIASFGREVEKYDQLVDSIESYLFQAIAVLQRDLAREERRVKLAEEASAATQIPSESPSLSPASTHVSLRPDPDTLQPTSDLPLPTPANSSPTQNSITGPGRRPSAISISSLHRPAFPLKLDLSSTALRITAEEASMFSSGLASPVTLAPKSARAIGPNEFPPDLMTAFTSTIERPVDINLTIPGTDNIDSDNIKVSNVGNTPDKPIELDLETMDIDMAMTDLFGDPADTGSNDTNAAMDGLFSPIVVESGMNPDHTDQKSVKTETPYLDTLRQSSNDDNDSLFASLGINGNPNGSQQIKNDLSASRSAPSPASLLASFDSASQLQAIDQMSTNTNAPEVSFDLGSLDLSNLSPSFFGNATESEVNFSMEFLGMESVNESKNDDERDKIESI